jgi:uncharacterized damage-inducible protein DinB
MQSEEFAATYVGFAVKRMERSKVDIDRCLDRLSDEQIWQRGAAHENSIANLLLHLEGNLRQWFLHGIDGQPDVRRRDDEFAETPLPVAEVRTRFAATLAACCAVVGAVPAERLMETIDPQPNALHAPMTILEAIFQIVSHLQLHTGQIILLTKQLAEVDLDLSIPRKR